MPLAKGIVITISVLVAAGIAVYESPQIQEWLQSSRRKIAIALSNWGDERNSSRSGSREDISMTEELGEEAECRRRKIREDIEHRRKILASYKHHGEGVSSRSFNTLVDGEGRLRTPGEDDKTNVVESKSSGVEITESETTNRLLNRNSDFTPSISDTSLKVNNEQRRNLFENMDRDRLHIPPISETSSNHPSESLIDLTPTSELSESELAFSSQILPDTTEDAQSHVSDREPIASSAASSHTEDDFYYAHPDHLNGNSVPADFSGNVWNHEVSSAPSIASSLSHIQNETFDTTSEGTMSDLGRDREDMYTPVSWSEVGSVISSTDGNAQ
ncbi:hypothetical protein PRK78_001319 [Emydomyces testavorans]|uniref:Uncharacterized protein n=1 Tax=Emydomyces testavorans TaxID=2070801 RepID=A0AAF0DCC2_9EURO|nr:hypothetical protein PRK78_001319 [Emydomyces testavorans]